MSDNKNYYYLKLKENFFDSEEMKLLESAENGYLYSNILLKMYLKSLKTEGRLMFRKNIPYNSRMLATITGHNPDIVEKAVKIFVEFGLIQILDSGAIYIYDIQNFIGSSSTEADRIRAYRNQIDTENKIDKLVCTNVQQKNDKSTPEIEIEKKIDIEIDIKENKKKENPHGKRANKTRDKNILSYSSTYDEAYAIYPHHNGDKNEFIKRVSYRYWLKIISLKSNINGLIIDENALLGCVKNYLAECDAKNVAIGYTYKLTNFFGRAQYYKQYIVSNPIKLNSQHNNGGPIYANNRISRPFRPTAAEHHAAVVQAYRNRLDQSPSDDGESESYF